MVGAGRWRLASGALGGSAGRQPRAMQAGQVQGRVQTPAAAGRYRHAWGVAAWGRPAHLAGRGHQVPTEVCQNGTLLLSDEGSRDACRGGEVGRSGRLSVLG